MMGSISTHLLLAVALFVLGIYYHEDMLLLAGNNYQSKKYNSVHVCVIENHWNDIINAAEVANYTCTGSGPTSMQATLNNSIANVSLIENGECGLAGMYKG